MKVIYRMIVVIGFIPLLFISLMVELFGWVATGNGGYGKELFKEMIKPD